MTSVQSLLTLLLEGVAHDHLAHYVEEDVESRWINDLWARTMSEFGIEIEGSPSAMSQSRAKEVISQEDVDKISECIQLNADPSVSDRLIHVLAILCLIQGYHIMPEKERKKINDVVAGHIKALSDEMAP